MVGRWSEVWHSICGSTGAMNEQVYKKIEVIGTSANSIDDAIENAVEKAHDSLDHLRWFEVNEIRGSIDGDLVEQWQVGLNLAFALDEKHERASEDEKAEMRSRQETEEDRPIIGAVDADKVS